METSIRNLATIIAAMTGDGSRILWDPSQPKGKPRRYLDVSGAELEFLFRATTQFEVGLRKTIDRYLGNALSEEMRKHIGTL